MNAQKLSKRLEAVALFVPTGAVVADIGSDHAYLPCYLIHKGIINRAIAGEVVRGPFESAIGHVKSEGLEDKIIVRLADGLQAIEEDDHVDTIAIAGMGGPLIVSILEKDSAKLSNVTRLILQPNIHAKVIRQWALQNGWAILDEVILEEDDKIYEVLVLQRGNMTLSEAELLVGSHLLAERSEVFVKKWTRELENLNHVLSSIEKAESTSDILEKRSKLMHQIAMLKEVLDVENS